MKGNLELLLPILLPIVVGGVLVFMKNLCKTRLLRIISGATLILSTLFVAINIFGGEKSLFIINITDSIPLYLKVDDTGRFFSGIVAAMFTLVGFYSFEYLKHEERENQFIGFLLITFGILIGLDFSGNLLTMYIFYELMTIFTVPLVIHTRTKEAVSAGFKYLIYSLLGAFMGLVGIFFLNQYGTTLEFSMHGVLNHSLIAGNEQTLLVIVFIMILGFGTKAGMFPLHGWLPTAHPVAPAPASAILSGVITKSGIIAIIRVVFFLFGADFIRGTWVQYTWMALATATVIMGSMMAYKEKLLKKRLAYSTVSQVSYVLFGLSTLTPLGFVGAMMHVLFHSIIKNNLFMSAGAIIYKAHIINVDDLNGIGKRMPVTMWFFTICSLSLVGIPPLSGFISKWYLATGGLESGVEFLSWFGPVALLVSALLTAGYLLSITIGGFFPGKELKVGKACEANLLMLIPLGILAALTLILGVFPGGLIDFLSGIASSVI